MKLAVVAADYTPGEADQLRRDMAAWRSKGRIDKHRETMIGRMTSRGIEPEFAERVFAQIQGFGEYGFPESHAASFALITYATAYLKTHHPVEFTCSLLNAQPMGFYTPATIIDDARRHGVEFFPVDVLLSDWDCTLEPLADGHAIRMGLRYLKGIKKDEWSQIEAARAEGPFESLRDFVVRSGISSRTIEKLAESGAFAGFGKARREALWDVAAFAAGTLPLPFETAERHAPEFPELSPFEAIAWDYRTTYHSPRGHPMQTIRHLLEERGLPSAEDIRNRPHGSTAHYAGMVICRQRPGTASGVVFITMEDEKGFVNLVVWPDVFEKYRITAKTTTFLGVSGQIQNEQGVTHLVVDRMWVPDIPLTPSNTGSRDFH
jgi:error-prone DNA polymerase